MMYHTINNNSKAELLRPSFHNDKTAFTLAEVLITLGIIGVVAALTIPSLIANYQEKVYISKARKAYYTLDQAVKHAIAEYGPVYNWPVNHEYYGFDGRDEEMTQIILPYIDGVIKTCTGDAQWNSKYCFSTSYKTPTGNNAPYWLNKGTLFMLKDGSSYSINTSVDGRWCVNETTDYANHCGLITVDTTGPSGPNVAGKDYINFMITKDGVLPVGRKNDRHSQSFEIGCLQNFYNCSAWMLYNDNMDYLHCPEKIGWDKANSCKD